MKIGVVATIQPLVLACEVTRALDCNHWWNVMPMKSEERERRELPRGHHANCRASRGGDAEDRDAHREAHPHDASRARRPRGPPWWR